MTTSATRTSSHRLRIVVLDEPIRTWDSELTQRLFRRLVALKVRGYQGEYPENILPLDGTDFFGTHLMICEQVGKDDFQPIVAYKAVTLDRCDSRRQSFPAQAILKSAGVSDTAVAQVMDRCRKLRIPISYDNAWTMEPRIRKDRELSKHLRNLTTTIGVYFHQEFEIPEWLVMGIKRFKTDEYFRWMGHQDITSEFKAFGSFDEEACMLHLTSPSVASVQVAEAHREYWNKKLVISPQSQSREKNKAA